MTKRYFVLLTALATTLLFGLGCGSSGDSRGGSGLTDAEIKKSMEPLPNDTTNRLFETTAEETVQSLARSMSAEAAKKALAGNKRRISGKVKELSPADSELPFLVLEGGTLDGKTYKVKGIFEASQREALKDVKAGDDIRFEGTSDGVIKEDTLEFKNCVLSAAVK